MPLNSPKTAHFSEGSSHVLNANFYLFYALKRKSMHGICYIYIAVQIMTFKKSPIVNIATRGLPATGQPLFNGRGILL